MPTTRNPSAVDVLAELAGHWPLARFTYTERPAGMVPMLRWTDGPTRGAVAAALGAADLLDAAVPAPQWAEIALVRHVTWGAWLAACAHATEHTDLLPHPYHTSLDPVTLTDDHRHIGAALARLAGHHPTDVVAGTDANTVAAAHVIAAYYDAVTAAQHTPTGPGHSAR